MDFHLVIKGFLIGISIAAPVGPIGILCIRRTIADGRISGLVSGLGAAFADTFFASIAGLSLTSISGFLLAHLVFIRLLGGFFLCFLGIKTFKTIPTLEKSDHIHENLIGKFISTFLLTLSNPLTILAFASVFTGFGILYGNDNQTSPINLILGVFLGSTSWWLILSFVVSVIRQQLDFGKLVWINRASGTLIFIFGMIALISILK